VLTIRKRSRLPHWDSDATYFVTFNLADAMPAEFREELRAERHVRIAELERLKERATAAELRAIDQIIRERAEECLDRGAGACWMRDPRIADLVANALMHFDESRYLLFAWTVMPNHVHAVLNAYERIDRILQAWKSFTAKEANRLLEREGQFWQDDYYDRTIRDSREFDRFVSYVEENPAQAGLSDWRWVRVYGDRLESRGGTPRDCGRDARSPVRNRN
jgi:REP element-mobilizing transposase RayT